MRIQFSLSCQKGTIIPINYQSEISNWIFSVLSSAGAELHAHIQQLGFDLDSQTFRLFTFSPLAIYPYEMDQVRQEFRLMGSQVKLSISFYLDPAFEQQIVHLFRQKPLQLGTVDSKPAFFDVKHWQIQTKIAFKDTMHFKAVSAVSVTSVEEGKPANTYLLPDNEYYDISFFHHLVRRFKAAKQFKSLSALGLLDPAFPMHFKLQGATKSRLIHLKPNPDNLTQLRGFVYDFTVSLPPPLMEFAYYSGFGEYPHLGFGYTEIK